MLTDYFRWQDNDRAIFTVLSLSDAAQFEGFLGSAHKLHAPGKETRFARPKPAAAAPPKPQAKSGNGPTANWRWMIFAFMAAGMFMRLAGQGPVTQPRTPLPQAFYPQLQYTGKDLNDADALKMFLQVPANQAPATTQPQAQRPELKELEARLVFEPSRDYETVLADYRERLKSNGEAPLRFVLTAIDRYTERGKAAGAVSLLDLMLASEMRWDHKNNLAGRRGSVWLRAFGWSDFAACRRMDSGRQTALTPEGEARVRKELQAAIEHTATQRSENVAARLLELSDHLIARKRFGEVRALLDQMSRLSAEPPLHESNVQIEIALIRRCLLAASPQ